MSLEQMRKLSITKVQWNEDYISTLGFTLSDGQTCIAGKYNNYSNSFDFPSDKKIVKVDVTKYKTSHIGQIVFYCENGILVKLGSDEFGTGLTETFSIGENERLIGCQLDYSSYQVIGITFLKWTID